MSGMESGTLTPATTSWLDFGLSGLRSQGPPPAPGTRAARLAPRERISQAALARAGSVRLPWGTCQGRGPSAEATGHIRTLAAVKGCFI